MISDGINFLTGKLIGAVTGENGVTLFILFMTAFLSALVAYWKVEEHKSVRDFLSFALPKN